MARNCVLCNEPIEEGNYRLVGIEQGTWASRYAHLGICEAEARQRFMAETPPRVLISAEEEESPEVEELTMDAPDPFPDEELPWFGMERRR